jgi:hypothetical protein
MRTVEKASDLYALPIEEFTQARNDLAARLKEEGDATEAARVKALKKPGVAAWAVNQLARQNPAGLEELFRLRDSIEAASSAAELRSRTEERRKHLTKLVAEGRKILETGGHAPAANTVEKISQTLLAADEDDRDELVAGTLSKELTSSSATFGAFGSFDAATVTFDDEPDEPDPRLERLRAEAEEAGREAARLEADALSAEAEAEAARDRAAEARRKATHAKEKAAKAEN